MSAEPRFLHIEHVDGVTTIDIDKPPINLYDLELLSELQRAAEQCAYDPNVRVVVVRSSTPGFFIAHFDVSLILKFPKGGTQPFEVRAFDRCCELFRTMPKLTIAVIEGRVGGGGSELALAFDVRYAARETAIFNQPEVALGILPGGGGTQRLPRLVGRSRAMEIILGCEDIDAETAERWGWVNRTFPAASVRDAADRLARRVAGFPPHAVAEAKASVLRSERGMGDELVEESRAFNRTLLDPAATAAMTAFLAQGGQTIEGESRLGDLAGEL